MSLSFSSNFERSLQAQFLRGRNSGHTHIYVYICFFSTKIGTYHVLAVYLKRNGWNNVVHALFQSSSGGFTVNNLSEHTTQKFAPKHLFCLVATSHNSSEHTNYKS